MAESLGFARAWCPVQNALLIALGLRLSGSFGRKNPELCFVSNLACPGTHICTSLCWGLGFCSCAWPPIPFHVPSPLPVSAPQLDSSSQSPQAFAGHRSPLCHSQSRLKCQRINGPGNSPHPCSRSLGQGPRGMCPPRLPSRTEPQLPSGLTCLITHPLGAAVPSLSTPLFPRVLPETPPPRKQLTLKPSSQPVWLGERAS